MLNSSQTGFLLAFLFVLLSFPNSAKSNTSLTHPTGFPEEVTTQIYDEELKELQNVPIGSVQVGDSVLSCRVEGETEGEEAECQIKKVLTVFKGSATSLIQLRFTTDSHETTIRATEDQTFAVTPTKGHPDGWKKAQDFRPGDDLIAGTGHLVPITEVLTEPGEFPIYNLEIEDNHTYYANDILIHNCNLNRLGQVCLGPFLGFNLLSSFGLRCPPSAFRMTPHLSRTYDLQLTASKSNQAGRAGRQEKWLAILRDDKAPRADRGWIQQELNAIQRGQRKTIRNPPGKVLAHERGREAAKGYSYQYSSLQEQMLHDLQHKYDDNGKLNKERPISKP